MVGTEKERNGDLRRKKKRECESKKFRSEIVGVKEMELRTE